MHRKDRSGEDEHMHVFHFSRVIGAKSWRLGTLSALALAVAACGGGGGDAGTAVLTESSSGGTTKPVTVTPVTKTVSLEWAANAEPDLAGYRIYYGARSGTYVQAKGSGLDAGRTTSYTVNGLALGATYYIAVTAYDVAGNESAYSSEVAVRVE